MRTAAPRRRTLTRERVVDAALGLVSREGIQALSMRRLGAELGVEGMALYTHVRDKDDLLDAVGERILADLDTDFDRTAPWQERVRRAALAWAVLQERYPRAFPLVYRSTLRTDTVRRLTEELLDALRTAGFDEAGAALAYESLVVLVDGALFARGAGGDRALQEAWRRAGAAADPAAFPRFVASAPEAAKLTWAEVIDSGLDLLIRGLEARLDAMLGA
jgi:AcrR family transcriptional regulator